MRIPALIRDNTIKAYVPSEAALKLLGEAGRVILSENLEWGNDHCPSLVTYCVEAIKKYFEDYPLLDELPCADRNFLLEILPTDLPLELVVPLIDDDFYWERRYKDKFGVVLRRKHRDWTWKCLYLERHMQEVVEQAQPQYEDENNMEDITNLCSPFVHRLIVTQLQAWKPPLTWDADEIPEVYPNDHINFEPILKKLENVEEVDIVYCMKDVSDAFNWNMFKLSVEDCRKLGNAVLHLPLLSILRIHRSKLEDFHTQALMQGLIHNITLTELDLSHCQISDHGALCIAKVMTEHPNLEIINLCDNRIGTIGAQGIGFAILHENCCPLYRLDLRLNPLEHDGTMGILRALVRSDKPTEVSLAACNFDDETAIRAAQMIKLNASLKKIDLSCNWFDEEGGKYLVDSMSVNRTLEWLDVRDTDITEEQLRKINKALRRNRLKLDEDEESVGEIVADEEQPQEYEIQPVQESDADEDGDGDTESAATFNAALQENWVDEKTDNPRLFDEESIITNN